MSPERGRPRCATCQRPASACICHWARCVDNPIELLLLQHPQEQHEAKGTAALLRLSLARCEVLVGAQFDAAALGDLRHTALLYPGVTSATSPDAPSSTAAALPRRLIVIDATWRKSRQMLAGNPLLQGLPRLPLRDLPTAPAYAALRKARLAEHLSTLEASVLALQQLEPQPERYSPLLIAFEGFVAEQLARRQLAQVKRFRPSASR